MSCLQLEDLRQKVAAACADPADAVRARLLEQQGFAALLRALAALSRYGKAVAVAAAQPQAGSSGTDLASALLEASACLKGAL